MKPILTRRDILAAFSPSMVARAQGYLNAVSDVQERPGHLSAKVKGSARQPYEVDITISFESSGKANLKSFCNCPVGWMCKHGAAVLLSRLEVGLVPSPPLVNPAVLEWVEAFRQELLARSKPARPPTRTEALFYVLKHRQPGGQAAVGFIKRRVDSKGVPSGIPTDWSNIERALLQPPRFIDEQDLAILRLLWSRRDTADSYWSSLPLIGQAGEEALERMLAAERLCLGPEHQYKALKAEAPRPGRLEWRVDAQGKRMPLVLAEPSAESLIKLEHLWYVDTATAELGQLELPYSPLEVGFLLRLPPLSEIDLPLVTAALGDLAPSLPTPLAAAAIREINTPPVPVLTLATIAIWGMGNYRGYGYQNRAFDFARPSFRYAEILIEVEDNRSYLTTPEGEILHIRRRPDLERKWLDSLSHYGLTKVGPQFIYADRKPPAPIYGLENEGCWSHFMVDEVPQLRAAGWEVNIPKDFRHHILEVSAWEADISEGEDGWFSLDMGIIVEGVRIPLAPLLYDLFRREPRWLDPAHYQEVAAEEAVFLTNTNGTRIRIPAERIRPIARVLIDLFDAKPEGTLRLSKFDAPRLADLGEAAGWRYSGLEAVKRFTEQLRHAQGVQPVEPPKGLGLSLRPYQLEGLSWLQYLRREGLAGILADDMGLGKTAQTLAHLLLEKESGRLDRPALIVLPTSLLFNWKQEAARFAPDLRLLSLHGPQRALLFPLIPEQDLVMTTYPLLWRDEEALSAHQYRLLVLDEAQNVKNAASRAAQVVRKLRADQRFCLTGTPLENHLGELWAQFDFLLPGFLGDSRDFSRRYRTPIEKQGDLARRELLAHRVKPFILRRKKEDVAKELPEKNLIIRRVELEGGQRDLYETVRSAMDERVRQAIANRGFARSQIVFLDALLKLRQVCCDPRLVKVTGAKSVRERAKLELLMEMLPELIDEGHQVLVFSQFTSMLDLIALELGRYKLGFVTLTGDTQDRETPIRRFQNAEVPIFLISLKAGGVGLNLTAADTVIHFDPWWNPAVENQATDRAHRIGQTKPVFVYKLVVADSIEEKILALQEKKADLAAGVLSEDAAVIAKFDESDLTALLAPLPPVGKG